MMFEEQKRVRTDMSRRRDEGRIRRRNSGGIEEERFEIVNLSGMSLNSVPSSCLNLTTICKLDLSNNNIQTIPESLTARLLNTVVFDIHSNQLKFLPNSVGCLAKLKTLNVSGNLLETLPRSIENCRSLEELNANFNRLTTLPDTIGFELVNLKKLSVNSNKLVFLPYSITHLTSLRILDARLNCLRSLPQDMENMINLELLNISQNFQYLQSLPYSIGLLISLVELDVSYNNLTTLPDSIGCLRKLQKLSIEGNPLVSPPLEVFEQSLHAVKEYLSEKMNAGFRSQHQKKKSWVGKLVKYGTFNARGNKEEKESEGFMMRATAFRTIQCLASPRYIGKFSPSRFIKSRSRNSFSG